MKKNNIPGAIGIIVSLGGAAVMAAWVLDISALKSVSPAWVSMKFATALSFFLCGIELYFIARIRKKESAMAIIVIPIISMALFLLMASLIASTVIGVNVGVEEMFVKDSMTAVGSVTPGRPSIATMIDFILIAMSGILATINIRKWGGILAVFGAAIAVTGLTAILGYCINRPLLYFAVPGKSSAMALHTAVLFVLLGTGVFLVEKDK